tara:strand:+ start:213 stop:443 length:231 start_codon:yes stop_codon:yes gene_type:complete
MNWPLRSTGVWFQRAVCGDATIRSGWICVPTEEQCDQRCYVMYWFPLIGDLCEYGKNLPGLQLIGSDALDREHIPH